MIEASPEPSLGPVNGEASRLVGRLQSGEVTCERVLGDAIARIEALDACVNAVVVRRFEAARDRARELDRSNGLARRAMPLFGLPITVKESFDVDGLPTCWGIPAFAGSIAQKDAEAVRRLVSAGAIVVGKTNVAPALADWQSANPVYGRTDNPWDTTRTPGGSSGGSAAALAAGFTLIELGSDIAGSIRGPAHFCGVFGHKPTPGLIPLAGHALPGDLVVPEFAVAGPMARSGADLRLAFRVLAGPDTSTATGWRLQLPDADHMVARLRIAVLATHPRAPASAAVRAGVEAAAGVAHSLGAEVTRLERLPFDAEDAFETFLLMLRAETLARGPAEVQARLADEASSLRPDDRSYRAVVRRAAGLHHVDWVAALQRREAVRNAWSTLFGRLDLVLCPAAMTTAYPHDLSGDREFRTLDVDGVSRNYNDQLFWAALAGFPGLPATVFPTHRDAAGLPVGVQAVAPVLHDLRAIAAATEIAAALPSLGTPAGFS